MAECRRRYDEITTRRESDSAEPPKRKPRKVAPPGRTLSAADRILLALAEHELTGKALAAAVGTTSQDSTFSDARRKLVESGALLYSGGLYSLAP